MNDYQKIVESDLQTFINNYDIRPIDLNTENYERNIVFLGCSLTYSADVDNKNTYPSKVQELQITNGIVLILVFMVVVLIWLI